MAKGFQALGHQTLTASAQEGRFQQSKLDYNFGEMPFRYFKAIPIPSLRKKLFAKYGAPRERILQKALKECDLFVFVSFSFRRDLSDLEEIKRAGKKIAFVFTGSDVRWKNAMAQDFARFGLPPVPYDDYDDSLDNLRTRLQFQRVVEKYADVIISMPNQSVLALRPYHPYRQFVDYELFTNSPTQRKRPVIVHAASNSSVKGSKHVLATLEKLKAEGVDFDFKILSGLPRNEIIAEYENCDILIGQMYIPSGGFQERELLACGKVVLTSMHYDYPDHQLENSPIVDVNPTNLEATLRELIPNLEKRQELANKARPFQEKHHSPVAFCKSLLSWISDNSNPPINPTFFRDHFKPVSNAEIDLINEFNALVGDENWYQSFVPPGERDGMRF